MKTDVREALCISISQSGHSIPGGGEDNVFTVFLCGTVDM